MISRYTLPEMARIWSDEHRYNLWVKIEKTVCSVLSERGLIPSFTEESWAKIYWHSERQSEVEAAVQHDVNAFLDVLAEQMGSYGKWVHFGMTSSDLLDTALAMQLGEAVTLIIGKLDKVCTVLKARALEHKNSICIGRTHGMWAEPTTFGLKLLYAYKEMQRNRSRLVAAWWGIRVGKMSGAVGTCAHLSPEIEEAVVRALSLQLAPVSTQIVGRDSHAHLFSVLALLATSVERIAVEMRHLARSEVGEIQEFFGSAQKGSSAMPHKRNPWRFETLCGLARVVRGYAQPALDNVVLWHERDISNSSVERIVAPDATNAVYFMLDSLASLLENMKVFPDRMHKTMQQANGLPFSGTVLLKLIEKGCSRQDAYRLVQEKAIKVQNEGGSLIDEVKDEVLPYMTLCELVECFDEKHHLRHVDAIFKRTLG